MMSGMTANDMLAFSELLTPHADADDGPSSSLAVTPGSFGAAPSRDGAEGGGGKKRKDPKDIWDVDEVPPEEAILAEDLHDARPRPKYDIFYKQVNIGAVMCDQFSEIATASLSGSAPKLSFAPVANTLALWCALVCSRWYGATLTRVLGCFQNVMSEDVFLGLGGKTPGSASCTHMTVKVTFPGHSMKVCAAIGDSSQ